ncbi:MAG: tetratricopeptide repeat protein, partial [Muribaculaceae bacterium]|nr:tetratricopeptide repeat protein [Muribaculaceae bacterium]
AEEMSRRTVADQPDNATYLDTLAWILYLKGQYAEALELQEKTMDVISTDAESTGEYWDHMGDIQYMNGQKDKAVESWKKALERDKGNKKIEEKIKHRKI